MKNVDWYSVKDKHVDPKLKQTQNVKRTRKVKLPVMMSVGMILINVEENMRKDFTDDAEGFYCNVLRDLLKILKLLTYWYKC